MESTGQPGPTDEGQRPSSTGGAPTWQSGSDAPASGTRPGGSWAAPPAEAPAGPAGYYYADVPNRIVAYIIDAIILGVIGIIVGIVLAAITGPTTTLNPDATDFNDLATVNFGATIISAVVNMIISAAYFIYTWTSMRATPGQRILGMQVGNASDGATLTVNQATIRWALLGGPLGLASALTTGLPGLGLVIGLAALVWFIALLVTTAQSPTKQGLHDRYANTVVVKAARAAA